MPITQSRMLALIAAAKDFRAALLRVKPDLQAALARDPQATTEDLTQYLLIALAPERLLTNPLVSPGVIVLEDDHFTRHGVSNSKARARARSARPLQRKQREGVLELPALGTPARALTPEDIAAAQVLAAGANISPEAKAEIERELAEVTSHQSHPQTKLEHPEPDDEDEDNDIGPDVEIEE